MAISDLLNRRVRAAPEAEEEVYSDETGSDQASDDGHSDEESDNASDGSEEEDEEDDDLSQDDADGLDDEDEDEASDSGSDNSSTSAPEDDVQASLSSISFGALAKAQASLGPKSKRTSKTSKSATTDSGTSAAPSPLDDIRARIREAREQKRQGLSKTNDGERERERERPSRSSKHAPAMQSSKYAVSRKRTVIEPPSVAKSRDPRFDPAVLSQNGHRNPQVSSKAYAFLDEYRADELKELKAQHARTKNPEEKERLKQAIRSAQDRLKTMENRKREKEILADHKKREKQLIREGKKSTPYYMKKSELKKEVLLKKYESMNSKDRAKAMERKRKKTTAKERKEMPWERRAFETDDGPGGGGGFKRRRYEY
ncbi:DUF947-domain-containing protein [Aspergillus heteromorphus CBS 117.55]|uniref:rRNA biogenesis protein RRP36 n=1 Tax=Aspergillus heteromorphus CBS 117.55 TaxID=1448321 RepID=A0A317WB30_9EURO|nr:DUF947-domain-containing protein [Aspergillus heteromorphus CBS 117.55]PWY83001.1 DUF947-domain-containing protein [Aspergillus heteromorphus CBS 117.55]